MENQKHMKFLQKTVPNVPTITKKWPYGELRPSGGKRTESLFIGQTLDNCIDISRKT